MEKEKLPIEQNFAQMDAWIASIVQKGEVAPIDKAVVKVVLECCGADFDIEEKERKKFKKEKYSNQQRSSAMKAVWGDKYKEYRKYCKEFAEDYEQRTGKKLPHIKFKKTGNVDKTSGMRQFIQQITAYAATSEEEFGMADLVTRLSAQAQNGIMREKGITKKKLLVTITIPGYNDEISFAPASFPPEFPSTAWEFLKK